jgi:hypothetical protein
MKKVAFFPAVMLLLIAVGALCQEIHYDFDKHADFSKFRTYKWVDIGDAQKVNALLALQIKQAVDAQLAAKGLIKVETDSADLLIGYQSAVDQETQWNPYAMGGGVRSGGMGSATSSTINVGTLVLDIYDPGTKQLVWRGNATKTIDPKAKPDKQEKNLGKAVAKLLKDYPPRERHGGEGQFQMRRFPYGRHQCHRQEW